MKLKESAPEGMAGAAHRLGKVAALLILVRSEPPDRTSDLMVRSNTLYLFAFLNPLKLQLTYRHHFTIPILYSFSLFLIMPHLPSFLESWVESTNRKE